MGQVKAFLSDRGARESYCERVSITACDAAEYELFDLALAQDSEREARAILAVSEPKDIRHVPPSYWRATRHGASPAMRALAEALRAFVGQE